jgi:hypothetical protein
MTAVYTMMKNKVSTLRYLPEKLGPKPPPHLPWLQPRIFHTLTFVVRNEVDCLDKQV